MEYIRSFISIDLPENIRSEIKSLQDSFRTSGFPHFRWVSISSIHLTLKFLGNVAENQVGPVKSALQTIAEQHPAFQLSLKQTGLFPNARRPRVVWVGFTGDVETLGRIQKNIDIALAPLGFIPEKRGFTPHLTLARIPEGMKAPELESFGKQWLAAEIRPGLDFPVSSLNLMKSTLRPTGAVYDVLASFPLSVR